MAEFDPNQEFVTVTDTIGEKTKEILPSDSAAPFSGLSPEEANEFSNLQQELGTNSAELLQQDQFDQPAPAATIGEFDPSQPFEVDEAIPKGEDEVEFDPKIKFDELKEVIPPERFDAVEGILLGIQRNLPPGFKGGAEAISAFVDSLITGKGFKESKAKLKQMQEDIQEEDPGLAKTLDIALPALEVASTFVATAPAKVGVEAVKKGGKAAKLVKGAVDVAKTTAKGAAIGGVQLGAEQAFQSISKLSEGDVEGYVKDVGEAVEQGASFGAAITGGISVIGKVGKAIINKLRKGSDDSFMKSVGVVSPNERLKLKQTVKKRFGSFKEYKDKVMTLKTKNGADLIEAGDSIENIADKLTSIQDDAMNTVSKAIDVTSKSVKLNPTDFIKKAQLTVDAGKLKNVLIRNVKQNFGKGVSERTRTGKQMINKVNDLIKLAKDGKIDIMDIHNFQKDLRKLTNFADESIGNEAKMRINRILQDTKLKVLDRSANNKLVNKGELKDAMNKLKTINSFAEVLIKTAEPGKAAGLQKKLSDFLVAKRVGRDLGIDNVGTAAVGLSVMDMLASRVTSTMAALGKKPTTIRKLSNQVKQAMEKMPEKIQNIAGKHFNPKNLLKSANTKGLLLSTHFLLQESSSEYNKEFVRVMRELKAERGLKVKTKAAEAKARLRKRR